MTMPVLATKLHIPQTRTDPSTGLRTSLVPRPRLTARLDEGLRLGRRLTFISAPPGYGKTTLIAEWGMGIAESFRNSKSPIQNRMAWLSLDQADNDPVRFLTYLISALQTVEADIGTHALGMLQAPGFGWASTPPQMESVLTGLINEMAAMPGQFILVLDDYHVIEASPIHAAVSFLLKHLPPQVHLVIATRSDPPLPIARLRGRGQLTELRYDDLRFTPDEAAAFLSQAMGLSLSTEDVTALQMRTEGWITGLQLAALAMRSHGSPRPRGSPRSAGPPQSLGLPQGTLSKQGQPDDASFIRAFTGSDRYILEYLVEEVLECQPESIQAFLLQTAILDRLTGPLCDAVRFGESNSPNRPEGAAVTKQEGGQSILEALERANLFIVPLDNERRWYRTHRLFADLLRSRLYQAHPDRVPVLHLRASRWYEQQGMQSEAVSHALASGDFERAADLIARSGWATLDRGEMISLLNWLDALPDDVVRSRPHLGILRAWALALTGQLDDIESSLSEVDIQQVPGEVAAVRAYVASHRDDIPRAIELCHQALERLAADNGFLRGLVAVIRGTAPLTSGHPLMASRALAEAFRLNRRDGQTHLTLIATTMLGEAQEMQGLLHQAVQTYREALQLASKQGSGPAPFAGMAYVAMAGPLYEWNDLDGAMRNAAKGVELSETGGSVDTIEDGYINLAQIYQAQSDVDKAFEMIREAEQLARRYNHGHWMAVAAEIRTRLWVGQGNKTAASRLAHDLSPGLHPGSNQGHDYTREFEHIALARVLIAQASSRGSIQGSETDKALRILTPLLEVAETAGRMGSVIKILALQALVYQAQRDDDKALSALERALSLAEPEGYVRTFVDEGKPMLSLLRRALSRGTAPGYVSRLLVAFGENIEPASTTAQPLVEPLSKRELEVLRLVAAGLSNREIGDELVVAVSTVKSHINHIHGKLGVRSRTQALARANELNLLFPQNPTPYPSLVG